jgi:hypothetical protein
MRISVRIDGRQRRLGRRIVIAVGLVVAVGVLAGTVESRVPLVFDRGSTQITAATVTPASQTPGPTTRSGTPASSATPGPTGPAPSFMPSTADGPVPANLLPPLATAPDDFPKPYLDKCHVQQGQSPGLASCVYGNRSARTTIVLFGDSHALSWFPAVERLATREGWRLLSLTMSACSPAAIRQWNANLGRLYTECTTWRSAVIARLVRERPQIVLVAGTRGFSAVDASGTPLVGDARTRAWRTGMDQTLRTLVAAAGHVVLIGDTPLSLVDPPACLRIHPMSVLACATPASRAVNESWLGEERAAAARAGAGFIDPTTWVCPSSPCPVVIGRFLVYRNPGHLTASFAKTLYLRLDGAIRRIIAIVPPAPGAPSVAPRP